MLIRTLIVLWILGVLMVGIYVAVEQPRFVRTLMSIGFVLGPVWALQFILTGLMNPLDLLNQQKGENK